AFFLSSPPETPPPPATQPALLCPPSSVCFAVATVCRSGRPAAGHNLDDQRAVVHGLGGGDLRGPGAAPAPPSSVAQRTSTGLVAVPESPQGPRVEGIWKLLHVETAKHLMW
uniref:Uncharacterized protein n=3 Tax=Aegilops tauschii subsp. strangulata TaxID=200361 RepID=A0A453AKN9_AEGTS